MLSKICEHHIVEYQIYVMNAWHISTFVIYQRLVWERLLQIIQCKVIPFNTNKTVWFYIYLNCMPLAYQPWYANNEYLILDWQKIHPAGKITKSITSRVTDLLLWIVERHLFNTSCWFKVYLYCNYLFCLFLSFFMYRIAFNLNWCNCYPRKPFGFFVILF